MKWNGNNPSSGSLYLLSALAAATVSLMLYVVPAHAAGGSKWTGCYVGGGGQYSMVDANTSAAFGGTQVVDVNGLAMQGWGLYGKVGCDVELLPRVVVGAWGDYAWHDNTDFTASFVGTEVAKASLKSDWAAGGRAGYLVTPDALVYALAGYTEAKLSNISSPANLFAPLSTPTLKGYVLGGGVDLFLGKGWFAEAEYSFANYDKADIALGSNASLGLDADVSTVRVGLAYKFNFAADRASLMDARPLK